MSEIIKSNPYEKIGNKFYYEEEYVKEKDKEIERLNKGYCKFKRECGKYATCLRENQLKEIERLNNIIKELEEELERESNMKEEDTCLEHNTFIDIKNTLKTVLKRLQELKGSDKE